MAHKGDDVRGSFVTGAISGASVGAVLLAITNPASALVLPLVGASTGAVIGGALSSWYTRHHTNRSVSESTNPADVD